MKKVLLPISVLIAFCTVVHAGNVDAGRIEIGGYASMSKSTAQNSDFQVQINPFAMFYLAQSFALGGSIGLSSSGHNNSTISLGPRAAYYFDIGNPNLFPYVAGGFSYFYWSSGNNHGSTFSIPIEGGIRIFLNDFVALDPGLVLDFGDGTTNMTIKAGFSMFLR